MTDVDEVWKRRSDEQLREAAGRLEEYTEEGRRAIQAELDRRSIEKPLQLSPGMLFQAAVQTVDYSKYSSAVSRAHWTTVLLMIAAVIDLVAFLSSASQAVLVSRLIAGEFISEDVLAANDTRQQLLGALQLIALVVTAVLFLRWLRRSYENLDAFGVIPSHTPGWAIGAWFVPFINLVRPYQIVKELWVMSEPARGSALIGWWWAAWLISGFLGQAVFRLSFGADQLSELLTVSRLTVLSDVVSIVAAILAVYVVRGITRRQEEVRHSTPAALAGT